jgi:hypothetical protein
MSGEAIELIRSPGSERRPELLTEAVEAIVASIENYMRALETGASVNDDAEVAELIGRLLHRKITLILEERFAARAPNSEAPAETAEAA